MKINLFCGTENSISKAKKSNIHEIFPTQNFTMWLEN
jgi:hypothetical protein